MKKSRETFAQVNVSFEREEAGAQNLKAWIDSLPPGTENREKLEETYVRYVDLLGTARLLTRMGDRLQARLKAANEELAHKNEEIARVNAQLLQKNKELQETLRALQESQRRRKALTVIGLSAIFIFMITEGIEYYIEQTASTNAGRWAALISFGLKALIAIAFKPMEELVEALLSRTVR
ncbi:MAG: hypothetical protein NZ580_02405 [Bacteroidia bacterium]|nr:hypothetical protein [Bacteroidia bacterium]MDW8235663.1 hypothetical protein [Bacteroidia bacterium]